MKKQLEMRLQQGFPGFFDNLYGDPQETCLANGIECPDEWYDLIYKLCYEIKKVGVPAGFKVIQVKEKFGSLRFYYVPYVKAIQDLVDRAENESALLRLLL